MGKDITFSLDPSGGADILQNMAMPVVKRSADAIAERARSMASSISNGPPAITISSHVGTIRRGVRAIATIKADGIDEHQNYIGLVALSKAKDAGRI